MMNGEAAERSGAELFPLGDSAILVQFSKELHADSHRQVEAFTSLLEKNPFPGMIECVPAFTSVTVTYDVLGVRQQLVRQDRIQQMKRGASSYAIVRDFISEILKQLTFTKDAPSRIVEIPVCYGGDYGPDLAYVAEFNQLTVQEVISIHSNTDYFVHMIGFAPGFPYLGGMSERIATPRRRSPRTIIPAGTVGIGGIQTGVYPIETPGGWQLIGRTPVQLFRPNVHPPCHLRSGDIIRFQPISAVEYERYKEGDV